MKRALIDRKMLDYRRYTSFLKEPTGARFNARPGRRKYFGFWTVSPVDSVAERRNFKRQLSQRGLASSLRWGPMTTRYVKLRVGHTPGAAGAQTRIVEMGAIKQDGGTQC